MKTRLMITAAVGLLAGQVMAGAASYGFRLSHISWNEKELTVNSIDASGTTFGPSLLFRLGESEEWAVGVDAAYGSFDNMDRMDGEFTLSYYISSVFGIFADARYLWYDYGAAENSVKTHGFGVGGGMNADVPLGGGCFVFASTRLIPIQLATSVADADGAAAVLWAYEAGLGLSRPVDVGLTDSSFYAGLGFRHQQMKGGEFDETDEMPFVEAGFKQKF